MIILEDYERKEKLLRKLNRLSKRFCFTVSVSEKKDDELNEEEDSKPKATRKEEQR